MTAEPACQKAPSAIRCIKTSLSGLGDEEIENCQKAPSAIRCIKTERFPMVGTFFLGSEST